MLLFENVSRETFLFCCAVCYNKIKHIFVRGDDMIGETGKIVALTNVRTPIEAEMLQDILQQEGIAVMVKEHGSGGYSKIYMGISLFGETLYVNDYDYPRAAELMNAAFFAVASSPVTVTSGRASAIGTAGNPAPDPMSSSFAPDFMCATGVSESQK